MLEKISISEAARRAGISRAAIRKHIKIGRIKFINGKIELQSFNEWLKNKQFQEIPELTLSTVESADVFASLSDAELHKTSYEAKLKELEYDLRSGQVVSIEEVAIAVGAQFASLRTKLLAIPAEMAPQLYSCKSVTEIQGNLHQLIVRALEDLTEDARWQEKLSQRSEETAPASDTGSEA